MDICRTVLRTGLTERFPNAFEWALVPRWSSVDRSINYMIYIRGNRGDYDEGVALKQGLGLRRRLAYCKAERNEALSGSYHGTTGPSQWQAIRL